MPTRFIFLLFPCFSQLLSSIIHGNVEYLGYYYLEIWVGTPSVHQTLLIDTGSPLTAFPCTGCNFCGEHTDAYFDSTKSSTFTTIPCTTNIKCSACTNNQCEYYQSYAEGSSISGIYAQDFVSLNPSDLPVFSTFGCHLKETKLFKSQKVDGIMGLSRNTNQAKSIVDSFFELERIRSNTFSMCLDRSGGTLTVGGFNESLHLEPVQWAKSFDPNFYAVQVTGIKIGEDEVYIEHEDFSKMFTTGTIFDSGTTFVFLTEKIYLKFTKALKDFCKGEGNCMVQTVRVFGEPQRCFIHDSGQTFDQFLATFPDIVFVLDNRTEYRWKPSEYFFAWPETPNYYCFGIYNNFEGGNIFGSIFMRGKDIIFDRDTELIGFASSNCNHTKEHNQSRSLFSYASKIKPEKSYSIFLVLLTSCSLVSIFSLVYILKRKNLAKLEF